MSGLSRMIVALAAGALASLAIAAPGQAREVHELNGYQSRFFALQRLEIKDRSGTGSDLLVTPQGWRGGRTERGNVWVGDAEEIRVVQMAASEHDLDGTEADTRRRLAEALRQRYGGGRVEERPGEMLFDGASETNGPHGRARVRSIIRIWFDGTYVKMLQFHIIVPARDWERPETADIVELFRAQLFRAAVTPAPSRP